MYLKLRLVQNFDLQLLWTKFMLKSLNYMKLPINNVWIIQFNIEKIGKWTENWTIL